MILGKILYVFFWDRWVFYSRMNQCFFGEFGLCLGIDSGVIGSFFDKIDFWFIRHHVWDFVDF